MLFPSKTDFLKLAKQGNVVPVCQELLADTETPLTAYHKLTESNPKHSFILESVEGGERLGRYSFIGLQPQLILSIHKDRLKITKNGATTESAAPKDPLRAVEEYFSQYRAVNVPGLPRFTGGMVGYLGCNYISCIEPVPFPAQDDLKLPLLYFMLMDTLVIFDRVRQVIQIVVNAFTDSGDPGKIYDQTLEKIDEVKKLLSKPTKTPVLELPSQVSPLEFQSNMPKDEYLGMVKRAKEYIKTGDIFQCVPSQRFSGPTKASPLEIYRALRTVNPSPYMFLMQLEGFDIIGSSPEIHVRCEDGLAEIRPIAGTRARGQTPEDDLRLEKDLLADEKERAEHLMLVDLARNDLGRVCSFKTVTVSQFMTVERYSHVMHIVSQVTGKILPGKTPFDLMRATFPAGTLSGAPKIRAMQIISELEKRSRGIYGGALGYFSFNGNLDTCITIRTLVLKDGVAYVQAGGGVVDDSTPEGEYTETVNKAKALVKAVSLANSFQK
jgi:anthranilate synthase component I